MQKYLDRNKIALFAGAWVALTLGLPACLFAHNANDNTVAAWGTWFGALAVGLVGLFAIPQLAIAKGAADTDLFLKVTAVIDDEEAFGKNFQLVRSNANLLKNATLSSDGRTLLDIETQYDQRLPNAVQDVLSALEKIGIIFHHAPNKAMIAEYVGDIVIIAHDALASVIKERQVKDADMYGRLVEMNEYCRQSWNLSAAEAVQYTNV